MLVTFVVFATIVTVFLLACVIYVYPWKNTVTTVPGMEANDEASGNFTDIQVTLESHWSFISHLIDMNRPQK